MANAAVRTGKASSSKIAVTKSDQTVNGMRK